MAQTKVYSNTKEGLNLRKRIPPTDYYATGASKVHYARFERIEDDKVVPRGKQDTWFDPEIGRNLRRAAKSPLPYRSGFHGAWYGVRDTIEIYQGALQQVRSSRTRMPSAVRVSLLFHDYLWDEQAVEGRSVEIVLQDENDVELAAALVNANRAERMQRMVGGRPGILDRLMVTADVLYERGPSKLHDPYVDYLRGALAPENMHEFFEQAASLDNRGANL